LFPFNLKKLFPPKKCQQKNAKNAIQEYWEMKVLVGKILKKNLGIVMCVKNAFVNSATDVKNIVFVSKRNNS
jgi:hypothetical protein